MSDRSLRGTRLGAQSMESDTGIEPAPRQVAEYVCPNGHTITIPFAAEVEVPPLWECRCGAEALLRDAQRPEAKPGRPPRTHWDMLLERRTIAELEALLDERLQLLRSGALHSSNRRSA
jgi:hypothetical protein